MISSYCSGEIQLGEFINVDNHQLGIYVGRGQGNSVQYYSISTLEAFYLGNIKNPYFNFIYGNNLRFRVMKCSPEILSDELKERYNNAIKGLELLNKQKSRKK